MRALLHGIFLFFLTTNAFSAVPTLKKIEVEQLHAKLEARFNTVDLLVRNQRSNSSDLRHQEKAAAFFKLYERIPFDPKLGELKEELTATAASKKLQIKKIAPLPVPQQGFALAMAIPHQISTDGHPFKLKKEQIIEEFPLRIWVKGTRKNIQEWVKSWVEGQVRLVEPKGGWSSFRVRRIGKTQTWRIDGTAFRYRRIRYPAIVINDPIRLLPRWARQRPREFAKQQPELWQLVAKTRAMLPKVKPLLEQRRQYLLNDARLSFFISKVRTTTAQSKL